MTAEVSRTISLEYLDSRNCQTLPATGFVLSSLTEESGVLQLSAYTEMTRLHPEVLELESSEENTATYKRKNNLLTTRYREIQAKIIMSPKTMKSLRDLIDSYLERAKTSNK